MIVYDGHTLIAQFMVYNNLIRILALTWLLIWGVTTKSPARRRILVFFTLAVIALEILALYLAVFVLGISLI